MAARLQGESEGGDIVLSEAIVADPEVQAMIATLGAAEERAVIKGFDQPVPYFRLPAE